jgi:hypothetical protein
MSHPARFDMELSKFLETPDDDIPVRLSTGLPKILSSLPASLAPSGRSTAIPGRGSQTSTPDLGAMSAVNGFSRCGTPDVASTVEAEFKSLKEYYDEQKQAKEKYDEQRAQQHLPPISGGAPVASIVETGWTGDANKVVKATGNLDMLKKFGKVDTAISMLGDDSQYAHLFGIRLPTDYHTHSHSGNRLWSNGHCPLCTQGNIELHDQKDEIKQKESDQDKLFLDMAIEVDQEDAEQKAKLAQELMYKAIQIANHNKMRAMQAQKKKKRDSEPKSMGDLFENRVKPPSRSGLNHDNAQEILQQIQQKKIAEKQQEKERVNQDRMLSSHFVQQYLIVRR